MRLATGPVCWGVDFADRPGNPPYTEVLAGASAAGFHWLELGPLGYLPGDLVPSDFGLEICGGFVFEPLHDPARLAAVEQAARATSRRVAELGGSYLVVIDSVVPERERTAGRPDLAPRLRRTDALRRGVDRVAAIARRAGLCPVLHPHVGTYVEFADEIEPLLDLADLCLDTGHLAYAGIDPVAALARHAGRLGHVHLKDVDGAVLARGLPFWDAIAAGVFCPLGTGIVDVRGALAELDRGGYDGWATIEQDRVRGSGTPLADLRRSLRACGFGQEAPWSASASAS